MTRLVRIPAISLWQPFAWALMDPTLKINETRGWPLPERLKGQRCAVHAAKRRPRDADLHREALEVLQERLGADWRDRLAYGAIIGTTVFAESHSMSWGLGPMHDNDRLFGDWSHEGRFHWTTQDPKPLADPVPCVGRQGWFTVELPEPLR